MLPNKLQSELDEASCSRKKYAKDQQAKLGQSFTKSTQNAFYHAVALEPMNRLFRIIQIDKLQNWLATQNKRRKVKTPFSRLYLEHLENRLSPAVTLGTNFLLEGPNAGSDSEIVVYGAEWKATSNVSWLHTNSFGTGNGLANFTFDPNTGATRTGTLTVNDATLTITQAGSSYLSVNALTTLVPAGLNSPFGIAVDSVGNVLIADTVNNAIKEYNPITNVVTTLVSSLGSTGLNNPKGVAVDSAGDVFIADSGNNAIEEFNIKSPGKVSTLVSSNLKNPSGVAVDSAGNVYIADSGNNTIKEFNIKDPKNVFVPFSSGLNNPTGVAVDAAGNLYIADFDNNAIEEYNPATQNVFTLISSGLLGPSSVAIDGSGNLYIADSNNSSIKEYNPSTQVVTTLVSTGLNNPRGVAVDASGNVYISDIVNYAVEELPRAYVDPSPVVESASGGSDALPAVLGTVSLTGPFAPTSDQSWLTITGVQNGVTSFTVQQNLGTPRTANISLLGQTISITQNSGVQLGTTSLLEGPGAGLDSVVLSFDGPWVASSNDSWLHVTAGSGSGYLVSFSFDPNTGDTRSGTLTIDGLTLTVTQAGSTYQAANPVETLIQGQGLVGATFLAVDASGNVYFSDHLQNAIEEYVASTQTVQVLFSGDSGIGVFSGVAVDASGNVYYTDSNNNAIKEYVGSTQTVQTLVSSGLNFPIGVAVDASGNVYIADTNNNAIKEWVASTQTVQTLVTPGLKGPRGLAVDASGNVYIADTGNNAVKEWVASTQTVQTLVSSGLTSPVGLAVDASGNVYFTEPINNAIKEWVASTQSVQTLVSLGLGFPIGVAVDAFGNVYFVDGNTQAPYEKVRAFVDPTPISLSGAAGSGQLPVILPSTQSLAGIYAPTSDQNWLTLGMPNNGVISYSFNSNTTGVARTAHINVLGVSITVTQAGLSTQSLLEGPTSGSDSVLLSAGGAWTATSNSSWITLNNNSQSGSGNALVTFSFAANTGTTRIGTLTIDGFTLTVTQAGSTYQVANPVEALVPSGLGGPAGVAVDALGNVYFTDTYNNAVKEWVASTQTVQTLISSGLNQPTGLAVDAVGNLYIADTNNNAIKEWVASTQSVRTLVSSGLNLPYGVAVDSSGNVYIANSNDNAIEEWVAITQSVETLISTGLSFPTGVAVDATGNLYISDTDNNAIKEWVVSTQTLQTLVVLGQPTMNGAGNPHCVAVDSSGNVYFSDDQNQAIEEWVASTQTVNTLVSPLNHPVGVAVDALGNVYLAETNSGAVKELVRAYVDPTSISVAVSAGSGQLPVILPSTQPLFGIYSPSSDQSWLTPRTPSNGVVPFSYTTNTTGTVRLANILLLGQHINITQATTPRLVITQTPGFSLTPLASFSGTNDLGPSSLVIDGNGNLFGTTQTGGYSSSGVASTIFEIANGSNVITTIATFDSVTNPSSLTLDSQGDLFGTTQSDGGQSTIFELPVGSSTIQTIALFNGTVGPSSLTIDNNGNLYGTTQTGGNDGCSSIFELAQGKSVINNLASFSSNVSPTALTLDVSGNLFGASVFGSPSNTGLIFELVRGQEAITALSQFIDSPFQVSALTIDQGGNLYGTTTGEGYGTVFELPQGSSLITTLAEVQAFGGVGPEGGVVLDAGGNLFGTLPNSGQSSNGAVFELNKGSSSITTLASFNGTDGSYPSSGVVMDSKGNLFGVSLTGGTGNVGTVFKLAPQSLLAGQILNPAFQVTLEDSLGHLLSNLTGPVTVSANGPGGFSMGTTTVLAVNGVATFSDLVLDVPGTYTLTATDNVDGGSPVKSPQFLVVSTSNNQLILTQNPGTTVAGQVLSPALNVSLGNLESQGDFNGTLPVTVTVSSGPDGFASGTTTVYLANGMAQFNDLVLNTAGTYVLSISAPGFDPVLTSPILVTPDLATQLIITQSPGPTKVGQILGNLQTVSLDQFGNVETFGNGPVTVSVASGPGNLTNGPITVQEVNGVANFTTLSLNSSGTYTLQVSLLVATAGGEILLTASVQVVSLSNPTIIYPNNPFINLMPLGNPAVVSGSGASYLRLPPFLPNPIVSLFTQKLPPSLLADSSVLFVSQQGALKQELPGLGTPPELPPLLETQSIKTLKLSKTDSNNDSSSVERIYRDFLMEVDSGDKLSRSETEESPKEKEQQGDSATPSDSPES